MIEGCEIWQISLRCLDARTINTCLFTLKIGIIGKFIQPIWTVPTKTVGGNERTGARCARLQPFVRISEGLGIRHARPCRGLSIASQGSRSFPCLPKPPFLTWGFR